MPPRRPRPPPHRPSSQMRLDSSITSSMRCADEDGSREVSSRTSAEQTALRPGQTGCWVRPRMTDGPPTFLQRQHLGQFDQLPAAGQSRRTVAGRFQLRPCTKLFSRPRPWPLDDDAHDEPPRNQVYEDGSVGNRGLFLKHHPVPFPSPDAVLETRFAVDALAATGRCRLHHRRLAGASPTV